MTKKRITDDPFFTHYNESTEAIELPNRFTYPFYYTPHPLAILAVRQLQNHIASQTEWFHDFGVDHVVDAVNVGKMFGVLVVKNRANDLGFLSAFSGKLAGSHSWTKFVPPIADYLLEDGFFRKEEKKIAALTADINALKKNSEYLNLKEQVMTAQSSMKSAISKLKKETKAAKATRKFRRNKERSILDDQSYQALLHELSEESKIDHFRLKDLNRHWKTKILMHVNQLEAFEEKLEKIKTQRREKSAAVQQEIFEQYAFLNTNGDIKTVKDIFIDNPTGLPPSGAGDCAAPKLLQYAFANGLVPIALAEFWWGQSPTSEIRQHGQYYPSCKGKCFPILGHMLQGMEVDNSPLLSAPSQPIEIETIYEDHSLVIINKPAGFLSVPGKNDMDSIQQQMENRYPVAKGTLMVHRLDRATSGLMIIAKSKAVHKALQAQFLDHQIQKTYIALLEGVLAEDKGVIELPLRPDLDDRPRQLVCHEHGKNAVTHWKKIKVENGRTRVHFFPMTGRTHQLRMHAAHSEGLKLPIVGDELYGQSADRMCLHAERLSFIHPVTQEKMSFHQAAEF